ncbi:MAG: hypothetical protein Q7J80_02420 [Anaerolineales bacterium]|nr:hypothetical protein [Anaerolineales bacterium]
MRENAASPVGRHYTPLPDPAADRKYRKECRSKYLHVFGNQRTSVTQPYHIPHIQAEIANQAYPNKNDIERISNSSNLPLGSSGS